MKLKKSNHLYIALGIQETDPGYSAVFPVVESLGTAAKIGVSFWQIETAVTSQAAFQKINTSMLDRRIDSGAALMIFNPINGQAHWHLRQPLSDLVEAQWHYQNNLFVSICLCNPSNNERAVFDRITRLGLWAPLSKTMWYISSTYGSRDAFHYLTGVLEAGDSLAILDDSGNSAIWRTGVKNRVTKNRTDRKSSPLPGASSKSSKDKAYARWRMFC